MELQTGEIPVEISVDDLRLRIPTYYIILWEIIQPSSWGVTLLSQIKSVKKKFECYLKKLLYLEYKLAAYSYKVVTVTSLIFA